MMRNCFRYGADTGMSDGELAQRPPQPPSTRAQGRLSRSWANRRSNIPGAAFVCLSRNSAPYWGELGAGRAGFGLLQRRSACPRATFAGGAIANMRSAHDSELVATSPRFPRPANHGLGPFIGLATSLR